MNTAFHTGVSGMISFQQGMDTLAHNMANVNTVGYKPTKTSFRDLLYTEMDGNQINKKMVGHGVKVNSSDLKYQQGIISNTNNPLDFALIGDGFFCVSRDGAYQYTRNGAFDISVQGDKGYLVTTDGGYLVDAKGKLIELSKKPNSDLFDLSGVQDKLGIFTFSNPYGLQPTDGSSFVETDISGKAKAVDASKQADLPYQLVQFALESSAVDLSQEMTEVIVTQKAFQLNAKIVQTADQIEEIVNNLR